MNLVIVDNVNKIYHHFIHVTDETELFICENINKINHKNKSFLVVQTDIDVNIFNSKKYEMDNGFFDKLIIDYNANLIGNEKLLAFWTR